MSLDAAASKKVLFVGETIIDVYHYGRTLGMPRKAPIIALEYKHTEAFQGGVVAAARHAETFCRTVHIASWRTLRKDRYIEESHNRKLFEVYADNVAVATPILPALGEYDAVVVTDYGHGMFDAALIERLQKARFLAVNVQTNAGNYGFNLATKWPHCDYLCVDEPEARLATQNQHGPIEASLERLSAIGTKSVITLGARGAIGTGNVFVPSFFGNVVDTMGAGDAFFAVTAVLAEDTPMEELLRIGNAAGKLKAQIQGHAKAVTKNDLAAFLRTH